MSKNNNNAFAENFLKNGPFFEYYENGQLAKEGYIYNGKLNGSIKIYNINGEKILENIYLDNKKIALIVGGSVIMIN